MRPTIEIYDCTLRDGAQSRDVNLSVHDKLRLMHKLDELGVDYIELGWPGSNPKDMEAFKLAAKCTLKNAKISAFGSTRRKGVQAKDDPNLLSILESGAATAALFGKTIRTHIELQLRMGLQENRDAIFESVAFLKAKGITVFYDAEHFFDGYADDKEYALRCLVAASEAGADCLVLCDTNGGMLPDQAGSIVAEVHSQLKANGISTPLGIHMHNDSGCAVANTLAALPYVSHIQGTLNGLGERCGNADLMQLLPNISLKQGLAIKADISRLTALSSYMYTLANQKPNPNQPYVGRNAFAHKGGIHVDALMKGASYEHISPRLVGNQREIILSELSGKANIVETARKFALSLDKDSPGVKEALREVEALEQKGYDMGSIEAEQYLLISRHLKKVADPFTIRTWKIMSEQRSGEFSECVITGTVGEKEHQVVAPVEGCGPVGATYQAMQKFLLDIYPSIAGVRLVNYKVRIAEERGPDSSVRVYIEFCSGKIEWGCVGVSTNILEASLDAISKGFTYFLLKGLHG